MSTTKSACMTSVFVPPTTFVTARFSPALCTIEESLESDFEMDLFERRRSFKSDPLAISDFRCSRILPPRDRVLKKRASFPPSKSAKSKCIGFRLCDLKESEYLLLRKKFQEFIDSRIERSLIKSSSMAVVEKVPVVEAESSVTKQQPSLSAEISATFLCDGDLNNNNSTNKSVQDILSTAEDNYGGMLLLHCLNPSQTAAKEAEKFLHELSIRLKISDTSAALMLLGIFALLFLFISRFGFRIL